MITRLCLVSAMSRLCPWPASFWLRSLTCFSGIFGWYLLGPLLGPTLGPLFGGLITQEIGWRWIFWILTIVCLINTAFGIFFLRESYAPTILEHRRQAREKDKGGKYRLPEEYEDDRPLLVKLASSMKRPLKILFLQPIVLTMAIYQAITFATTYTLYTNFQDIYSGMYGFNTTQVGLMYLGPGIGFLLAVWFIVPRIDTVYNALTRRNKGTPKPEFRLPIANIGSVLIPISLFWFAWTIETHQHWFVTILSTVFFGIGQVCTFRVSLTRENAKPEMYIGYHPEQRAELLHRCIFALCCISYSRRCSI